MRKDRPGQPFRHMLLPNQFAKRLRPITARDDDILAGLEAGRSEAERLRRDRQLQAWRQATPADEVA